MGKLLRIPDSLSCRQVVTMHIITVHSVQKFVTHAFHLDLEKSNLVFSSPKTIYVYNLSK